MEEVQHVEDNNKDEESIDGTSDSESTLIETPAPSHHDEDVIDSDVMPIVSEEEEIGDEKMQESQSPVEIVYDDDNEANYDESENTSTLTDDDHDEHEQLSVKDGEDDNIPDSMVGDMLEDSVEETSESDVHSDGDEQDEIVDTEDIDMSSNDIEDDNDENDHPEILQTINEDATTFDGQKEQEAGIDIESDEDDVGTEKNDSSMSPHIEEEQPSAQVDANVDDFSDLVIGEDSDDSLDEESKVKDGNNNIDTESGSYSKIMETDEFEDVDSSASFEKDEEEDENGQIEALDGKTIDVTEITDKVKNSDTTTLDVNQLSMPENDGTEESEVEVNDQIETDIRLELEETHDEDEMEIIPDEENNVISDDQVDEEVEYEIENNEVEEGEDETAINKDEDGETESNEDKDDEIDVSENESELDELHKEEEIAEGEEEQINANERAENIIEEEEKRTSDEEAIEDLDEIDEEAIEDLDEIDEEVIEDLDEDKEEIENSNENEEEDVIESLIPDKPSSSANDEFVEGLDDFHKLFEDVDPPTELDVGAGGQSIQEVLMGQGVVIISNTVQRKILQIQTIANELKAKSIEK